MSWAIDPTAERIYVTLEDRRKPLDEQTWWRIRDLPERIATKLDDALTLTLNGEVQGVNGFGTQRSLALKQGLRGTVPTHPLLMLVDCAPVPVHFEFEGKAPNDQVSDRTLEHITKADKNELALAIKRDQGLDRMHEELTRALEREEAERNGGDRAALRLANGPALEEHVDARALDLEKSEPSHVG